jgi:hypothetical protein
MTTASIGYGSSFWLHDGTALFQLVEVTEIGIPEITTDTVEATHLLSPNRTKEFIKGLSDGGEFPVTMNLVKGSATDTKCQAARADPIGRQFKIVFSDAGGLPDWDVSGFGLVTGYVPNALTPGDVKTATLTIKVSGALTEANAV